MSGLGEDGKPKFGAGQKIVYLPDETVIPEEMATRIGVIQYLARKRDQDNREVLVVKRTRLRGEPSYGIVLECDQALDVGTDMHEALGVSKFMAPIKGFSGGKGLCGDAAPEDPKFSKFTDVENHRNYTGIFEDGENVHLLEKIHGTNSRIGIIDGEWVAGSRKHKRKPIHIQTKYEPDPNNQGGPWIPADTIPVAGDIQLPTENGVPVDFAAEWWNNDFISANVYWSPLCRPEVRSLLIDLSKNHRCAILYGEIYGAGVQSLNYGVPAAEGYAVFAIQVDGRYMDWSDAATACALHWVPTVPTVYEGPYSLEKVKAMSQGPSAVPGANHFREGVVVLPEHERTHPKIGRVCLKYVSDQYLLSKGVSDSQDA